LNPKTYNIRGLTAYNRLSEEITGKPRREKAGSGGIGKRKQDEEEEKPNEEPQRQERKLMRKKWNSRRQ
jgi:hypothetical protein